MINLDKLKEFADKEFKEKLENIDNFKMITNFEYEFEYETIIKTNTSS